MKGSVVIFGAGAIGRGLIADLVAANGLRPVFVEANAQSAHDLKQAHGYVVHLTGKIRKDHYVTGYEVLTLEEGEGISKALSNCLFMATAVGGQNLKTVASLVALGFQERKKPLNILVCENWPHAENVLAQALLDLGYCKEHFACIRSSVERMVHRTKNSVDLVTEGGQTLYADSRAWKGEQPCIEGLTFSDNIEALYARKLYTSNAGHAALAYLGNLSDCTFIYEALEIPRIKENLRALFTVAKEALSLTNVEFSIENLELWRAELEQHVDDLITWRYCNRDLTDTVERVARNPLRKLGTEERLAGLAHLLERCALPSKPVSRVIGAAMHYRDPGDLESVKLGQIITREGPGAVLEGVCGFRRRERCYKECIEFYEYYSSER
ncbi:MAG: hypothetical protein AMJ75_11485 [Phycisphaerae bacterium SM1_79]|nr:MAG: hypothetical protein AMJ75_11485 [Phycisphaerae bacterium SM1_79]